MPQAENPELDARGLLCPLPVLKARRRLNQMAHGEVLTIYVTDPNAPQDFALFCAQSGHQLLDVHPDEGGGHRLRVRRLDSP